MSEKCVFRGAAKMYARSTKVAKLFVRACACKFLLGMSARASKINESEQRWPQMRKWLRCCELARRASWEICAFSISSSSVQCAISAPAILLCIFHSAMSEITLDIECIEKRNCIGKYCGCVEYMASEKDFCSTRAHFICALRQ